MIVKQAKIVEVIRAHVEGHGTGVTTQNLKPWKWCVEYLYIKRYLLKEKEVNDMLSL